MKNDPTRYVERFENLMAVLARCPEVTRLDRDGRFEAETLAHALLGLEQSFIDIIDVQIPRLEAAQAPSPSQTFDILLDITNNLRHALYHIKDSSTFAHLLD